MDNLKILLLNPPFKDFAAYDLFFKPYGLLNISTFFKFLGFDPVFIDCIDKNNEEFEYEKGYHLGNLKNDGTGKFNKIEIEKPDVLKHIKRKYFHYGISINFLEKYLNNYNSFDLIFINVTFTYHYNILYDLVPVLKKHSQKAKIFLGGIYPIVYYTHASNLAKELKIDYVISGGFEQIIPFLLKLKDKKFNILKKRIFDYFLNKNIKNFNKGNDNIINKNNNNIKNKNSNTLNNKTINNNNNEINNNNTINNNDLLLSNEILKKLPYLENFFSPDWNNYRKLNYGIIRTEKGCPYNCPYCSSKIIFKGYREKPIELILKELRYFKNKNVKNIAFYDDALLLNNKRIKNLLKLIYNEFKDYFTFYLPNAVHLRFLDEEILELFKKLNFKMIRFGFETADEYWIRKRGNKFEKEDLEHLFSLLKNSCIDKNIFKFYILIGLPDQTENEVKYSVNYLLENGYQPYFALYSPIPSTLYYNNLVQTISNNKDTSNIENRKILYKIKYDIREPLFQNPSIYTYNNTIFTEEKVKKWKEKIKKYQFL